MATPSPLRWRTQSWPRSTRSSEEALDLLNHADGALVFARNSKFLQALLDLLPREPRTLYRSGRPFSSQEQRILELLANQIAILLGNIRANEQIQNLADTDDLTGIWNKRAFRRQLPSEIERARTYGIALSLMLFDIDDFKEVNDRYGHMMGDVLLSELCGTVCETLRPPDLFARFGGDEFAVILPHTDLLGARSVAERMIKRVRELQIGGPDEIAIRCTISIGIAALDGSDKGASELLARADERLYDAKRIGKDRFSL